MVIKLLDVKKKTPNKEILSPEVAYLSTIEPLMYLANYMRPDIA